MRGGRRIGDKGMLMDSTVELPDKILVLSKKNYYIRKICYF